MLQVKCSQKPVLKAQEPERKVCVLCGDSAPQSGESRTAALPQTLRNIDFYCILTLENSDYSGSTLNAKSARVLLRKKFVTSSQSVAEIGLTIRHRNDSKFS